MKAELDGVAVVEVAREPLVSPESLRHLIEEQLDSLSHSWRGGEAAAQRRRAMNPTSMLTQEVLAPQAAGPGSESAVRAAAGGWAGGGDPLWAHRVAECVQRVLRCALLITLAVRSF